MISLSVVIITKNEEHNIVDCVRSVSFANQIIVVDCGSSDNTVEVAHAAGAEVIILLDWQGFGAQKNRALEVASARWVLSIDADERLTPELALEIQAQLAQMQNNSRPVAFEIPRATQFCGVWIRHCGWSPDYVLRLFQRDRGKFSNDLVHERLLLTPANSTVIRLKNSLLHYSYPTPNDYWRKLQRYSQDWARQRYAQGKKTTMTRAASAAVAAFFRSYIFRLGFLDGAMGFAVCTMQAQSAFGKYFELYCLGRKNEK